jgi:hypothetical protein
MNEILKIPFAAFDNNWNVLQKFLERRGFPPYEITDNLDLRGTYIESFGNLQSIGGTLKLDNTAIKSLGNLTSVGGGFLDLSYTRDIESLGNLTSFGGNLNLRYSKIKSLGNLTSVGGYLNLTDTPLSKKYSEEEIREMVKVGGKISF